jgi:hypothetical protein
LTSFCSPEVIALFVLMRKRSRQGLPGLNFFEIKIPDFVTRKHFSNTVKNPGTDDA